MGGSLHLALKPGERIYLNGAVIQVDRRVRLEVLNDAVFMLGAHVLQAEQATTPLRQLYFAIQTMLMEPETGEEAALLALTMLGNLRRAFSSLSILAGLDEIEDLILRGRPYPALKIVRSLYAAEAIVLADGEMTRPGEAA